MHHSCLQKEYCITSLEMGQIYKKKHRGEHDLLNAATAKVHIKEKTSLIIFQSHFV